MMFGTPAAQPSPAANKNQTMMFGTAGANTAPPPAAPPAPKANQTMMFGTPASNAAPPPPAAPSPSSKATMVFGAPAAAPAAAAKNQTMMFGTPASNAAANAPPPAAVSPKQTMVFGSAAPLPPSTKQTMVFGTAASNAAASLPPPAPSTSGKHTMVFGAPVSAPPAAAKNQTMMFGTPASNQVSEPAEETVLDEPRQSSRTVLFGTPVPQSPQAAPAPKTTMMFGRPAAIPKVTAGVVELAGMSADEGQPNESTVRVDVAEVIEGHGNDASQSEPPRHDRTQRFAMSDAGLTPPEGKDPVQDRHNRTQLFAMSTAQERTAPGAQAVDDGDHSVFVGDTTLPPGAMPVVERSSRSGGTDLNSTLPPDGSPLQFDPPGVSLLHDPDAMMAPSEPGFSGMDGPVATTLPNLPMLADHRPMAPLALELPPEPMGSPADLRAAPGLTQQQQKEDAAALKAARGGGAGRAIVIILLIVAIALAGVLVYRLFGRQLLGTAVPLEAIQATEQALATLRLDDQASQEKAVAQLTAVLAQHPTLLEPQGALVIAIAVRYDDAQGELTRLSAKLRTLKANDAPEARLTELEARVKLAQASATELKAKLEEAATRLQGQMTTVEAGTSTHLAMLRADGLARGVLGDGEALTRAVAFRQRSGTRDDWVDLIEPEYALNGGSSVDEAITQLVVLKGRASNSTFLRPYVLLARLELRKGEPARAKEELEQVATMNSRHEIARELLASLAAP